MQEREPSTDATDLLHRISRWSSEAAWTTGELQETLRESGVDPDRLLSRVMTDVQPFLHASAEPPRPLLVALRQQTQLPPSAIAQAMDVPVTFLSVVSRHPKAVPTRWRQELARRAEGALQVAPQVVMTSFEAPFQVEMAASRDTPYTADTVQNYEDILERAGLSPEAHQFWQALALDETV